MRRERRGRAAKGEKMVKNFEGKLMAKDLSSNRVELGSMTLSASDFWKGHWMPYGAGGGGKIVPCHVVSGGF